MGLLGGSGGVGGLEGGLFLDLGLRCDLELTRVLERVGSDGFVVVTAVSEVGGRLLGLRRWRFFLASVGIVL